MKIKLGNLNYSNLTVSCDIIRIGVADRNKTAKLYASLEHKNYLYSRF